MKRSVNPLQIVFAATQVASLPDAADSAVWIKLVPAGTFKARDGRGPFHSGDLAAMQAIVERTKAYLGATDLVIDYDHQSFFGAIKGVGGTAKAAGWIKQLEAREDGIWGQVEWTPLAARAIKRGEYRYISPTYNNDKSGRIHILLNAALLNMPALDLVAIAAGADHSDPETQNMDKIAKALGLDDTASEDTILAAINTLSAERVRIVTAAGLKSEATADEIVTTLAAALAGATPDPTKFVPIEQVTALTATVNALQATIATDKAEEAVAKAIAEGKLVPALKDWGLTLHKADPAQFDAFVAQAPSLTANQLGAKKPAPTPGQISEADEKIIVMLGLDREAFVKTREAEAATVL